MWWLILSLSPSLLFANTASDLLQKKLNTITTMSAHFKQIVYAKKKAVSTSSGTMAIQRPGHFRWQTKNPMEQLIVADGKNMWVYDVELEQVSVKKQDKGLGGTAALFLSGYDNSVANDFIVEEHNKGKLLVFDLKARAHKENFQRIQLAFSGDDLTSLQLFDQLGQVTKVDFSQEQRNIKLSDSLFKFRPPKGVDVVRQ